MRCISHVSDLKIMASQALLLIHKHLSHFLYLRKVEAMSPGRLSRSYPCFCSQNCCYQTWGFFIHIVTARACGLAAMRAGGLQLPVPHMLFALSHLRWCWYLRQCCQTCTPVLWRKKSRSGMSHSCLPALALVACCCPCPACAAHREPWASPARGRREMEHNVS